ncbi:molybdopterin-dependent oxidoreductase [Nocardioides sp. HDW12B]|uniref:molybdopterin-dependent oxidoreductase n=1 Tax=Nocardioides sp. HDW12B TaxID=2714939 RepID=UPI00140CF79F|nr:molybdopterin-dependent oxidoreductase [Nocardioides sp. HDW12B]QIK67888.1 molybdopterin-dependent oxidoreductase [Nocardioides sp. HDW12B]
MSNDPRGPASSRRDRLRGHAPALLLGGLVGLLSGAAAVAVSEAVTALVDGVTSPLLSVGNRAVDWAPRPLKEFAIETFGTADKPVLIGSVIATVALLAVAAGAVGAFRPRLALAGFLVLSAVAGAAALTDRSATAGTLLRLVPVLALVVVGLLALVVLLGRLGAPLATGSGALATVAGRSGDGTTTGAGPVPADRRQFLLASVGVVAFAAAGGIVSRVFGGLTAAADRAGITLPTAASKAAPVPSGTVVGVKGVTPYLTENSDFYRVDTALKVPDVPIDGWTLRIHGMVDNEIELTYADILERPLTENRITMTCVSNPVGGEYLGNALWLGIPLHELLAEAGVQDGADAVKSTSADDFTAGTPLEVLTDKDRGAMVAIGMNGEPLPLEHGFPARMVTPGLYGYVSATKWLVDLEVTRFSDFKAYWTTRGYSAEAPIKTSSRIDVPRSFAQLEAGPNKVAGVAWAQASGIEKVEVRVDGGDWEEARLGEEDGLDTWRQWVYDWDADSGSHTLEVRATDRTGFVQTGKRAPIAPDGSTGWDSKSVTVA